MTRSIPSLAIGAAVAVLALSLVPASAALATDITNPADNPAPITLTVDGQVYHDGQDTLPGYDDYACTSIPGVSYDFADNEIDYPDGQTAHWTEWDRIPGYAVWLKQQSSPSPKPTASSSSPATTTTTATQAASAGGSTGASAASATSSKASSSKVTSKSSAKAASKSSTKPTTKTTTKTTTKATAATGKKTATSSKPDAAKSTPAQTSAASSEPTGQPTVQPTETPVESTQTAVPAAGSDNASADAVAASASGPVKPALVSSVSAGPNTTSGGLAILAVLLIGSVGTLAFHRFARPILRRGRAG